MSRTEHTRDPWEDDWDKLLLLLYPIAPGLVEGVVDLDLENFQNVHLWGWTISMPGTKEDEERIWSCK